MVLIVCLVLQVIEMHLILAFRKKRMLTLIVEDMLKLISLSKDVVKNLVVFLFLIIMTFKFSYI